MALIVKLNGSNYVSDKTKAVFEQALQDEHKIAVRGNGGWNSEKPANLGPASAVPQPTPSVRREDYSHVLASLERGLTQSHEHQQMTMRVHEQYLSNQSDYANIFSQLMQQQGAIFAGGNTHPQQAEIAAQVLESLARSMTHFHNLQGETLNVHKQFLNQQSAYAQTYVQVIQQQQEALLHGNGNGKADHQLSAVSYQPSAVSVQPPAISYQPPAVSYQPPAISVQPSDEAQITATAEPATTTVDTATLTDSLLDIVSEKTGYPAEMLELELDMEADLSIDSIKRVEILGALQEKHPELPTIEADALTELRTLGQIIAFMESAEKKA